MLAPDNFVQTPDFSQNFNRYSYALNNPLMFKDPSGEFIHLIIGAAIGGIANWLANGAQFNAAGLGHFGVGALAGGLGAGIGAGFGALASGAGHFSFMSSAALGAQGFGAGAAVGFGTGFTGGMVTGTGNSLIQGQNIGKALSNGLNSGLWGGAIGGLTGGITGGIGAARAGNDFWSGGLTAEDKLGRLYDDALSQGIIDPEEGAVGVVRMGRNYEMDGAWGKARYGKRMVSNGFIEVDGVPHYKAAYRDNELLFSRKLIRQMWSGKAPLEAINHEVIHANDMFNASYWHSQHVSKLVSDHTGKALEAWMEVRAYSINANNSTWHLFSKNLNHYKNILTTYGIH
jgi:hypothetical protein